jgi:hypothetical protein
MAAFVFDYDRGLLHSLWLALGFSGGQTPALTATPAAPPAAPPGGQVGDNRHPFRFDGEHGRTDIAFVGPVVRIQTTGPLNQSVALVRRPRSPRDALQDLAVARPETGGLFGA